ncbi:MAG: hypothetical protein GY874_22570 [Desulfobacteraceae bacterium]|nr:hypothetical protein [Desulfobacteraceae bacterium]
MAAVPNNNNTTQNNMLPEQFNVFKKGTKFTCCEDALKNQITSILEPYGVRTLSLGGAHSNPDESTKQNFPHKRWFWVCGSCEKKARGMDDSEPGCCGLKIRCLLQDKKEDQEPYLEKKAGVSSPGQRHSEQDEDAPWSSLMFFALSLSEGKG